MTTTKEKPRITEKVWQSQAEGLAKTLGWKCYHTFLSRWSDAGFPDLVLVRDRVIYAELKSETGKVKPKQQEWLDALKEAGAEVYVWKPSDWNEIVEILRGKQIVK